MAIFCQAFINAVSGNGTPSGWSEGYWQKGNSSLPDALLKFKTLAEIRLALLGNGCNIYGLRVSDPVTYRDSLVDTAVPNLAQYINPNIGPPVAGVQPPVGSPVNPNWDDGASDFAWTGLWYRMDSNAPHVTRSIKMLGGIPDFASRSYNKVMIDPTWVNIFTQFAFELKVNYGIYGQDNNTNTNPQRQITGVAFGKPAVVTCGAHGFVTGDKVLIRGVKSDLAKSSDINRIWQVNVIDAGSFSLTGSNFSTSVTYFMGGTATKRTKVLQDIYQVKQDRFGSHRRGRPNFLFSAKRPAKR